MNKVTIIFCLLIFILLNSCSTTHSIRLVDMKEGHILKGQYNQQDRSVKVVMPNGEILTGYYSINQASSMTFGRVSGFSTTYSDTAVYNTFGNTSLFSSTVSHNGQAYAILKGNQGTVMEVLVNFTGSSGFGQAVTNKGKRYGVQF